MRPFWQWFSIGAAMMLVLTGCAALQPPAIPYFACYSGTDSEGDQVILCSPVEKEFIEQHIKAPYIAPR